jgi:AraC-like DNA-binding protein
VSALETLSDILVRHVHNDHRPTLVDGLSISATEQPIGSRPGISEPTLAVVVQGRKRTTVGDRVFEYGAGEFLIVTLDLPMVGQVTEASPAAPFLGFGIRLDPVEIASLLLDAPPPQAKASETHSVATAKADNGLLDAAARLVGLLDAPEDAGVLAPLYRREIAWRLLTGAQQGLTRQIGITDGSLAIISRSVRWIRDHFAEPVRVEQLARLAGMSSSVFHRHFRAATHVTPIQYQKAIRLQEARLLLMSGSGDVSEIAHAVGYDSASQFSREYRRRFGAPPGRDSSLLRGMTPDPIALL